MFLISPNFFLTFQVEVFNQRVFQAQKCDLSIHMRYGLVQILNTALTLLSDEDSEIRQKAIQFTSRLDKNQKICNIVAFEKLTQIGLDYFEDCAEWFLPITNLSLLDWALTEIKTSQLFENGDGINVYAEQVLTNGLYYQVLKKWLDLKQLPKKTKFQFLNCPEILKNSEKFNLALDKSENRDDFLKSPRTSPKGYTKALKLGRFLDLVSKYPFLVNQPLNADDCKQLSEIGQKLTSTEN